VLGILEAKYVSDWVYMSLLCGRLVNLEVSAEDIGASEANFASGIAAGVDGHVVHLRHVDELDVVAGHGTTHMAGAGVAELRDGGSGAALRLSVAFDQRAAHGNAEEIHDVAGDGC
jgi:hypothetical protein